jgi:alpha-L-arabinofuranosidase
MVKLSIFRLPFFLTALLLTNASTGANDFKGGDYQDSGQSKINGVRIIPDAIPVKYDRMLFGQFIEHFHRQVYGGIFEPGSKLSDAEGFRMDVIEALRELKVPVVRWPGGCFVSAYHWIDGVGANRVPTYDKAWKVEEPNTFGTDEYVRWCRKIGAEPYICTNAGSGTAEEMSDWVEYCNLSIGKYGRMRMTNGQKDPYPVIYWSVGNENWGGHEIGAKTSAEWGFFVRESAKMMRSVTPELKLFAAALPDRNWTLPLLKEAGHLLDYVSIHGYWDPLWAQNNISPYLDCMMRTGQPEESIKQTIGILDESGYRGKIKIAFDEWNLRGWHHPDLGDLRNRMDIPARDKNDLNSTYTMADALFSACFLNSCLRFADDVKMACFAPVVNARGPLYVYPGGLVKRTTYHVLKMYADRLEPFVQPITISSETLTHGDKSTPALDVILTCNENKTRYVYAIVNKNPVKEIEFDPGFNQLAKNIPAQLIATVLSGRSENDFNDVGSENAVIPEQSVFKVSGGKIRIPPHSLVLLPIE